MRSVVVLLLVALCGVAFAEWNFETDSGVAPAGEYVFAHQVLSKLAESGVEVKREKTFPPIVRVADCSNVVGSKCMTLVEDTVRKTWWARNCCATAKQPVISIASTADTNILATENCIAPGSERTLWWMEENMHLEPTLVASRRC